ncbi:MAG: DUF1835 domain-containing protein, partial [Chitinophagaceae bacterium]|nr:DUF1835 domain-containing protein [Chitinophagaceae bacterium]
MIHILVGDMAAKQLEAAFELDENLKGEIFVLKDTLGIGFLKNQDEHQHDKIRTEFWKSIIPNFQDELNDEKRLLEVIEKAIPEEEPLCLWLSPCVSDVCAYYWLLNYTKKHPGLLHTINCIGLPFLDENGKVFYPTNYSDVPPKEFLKTKRLLKEVSLAEYEVEGEEWEKLCNENEEVRIYEGGKKISSQDVSYFDKFIFAALQNDFSKATKIVNEVLKNCKQTVADVFVENRLKTLIKDGFVISNIENL